VIWGANPAVAHPVMYRWIADSASDDDSELIVVVDPVESETVDDADLHAQVDPGTDLAFARAVLAQTVADDAVDREFVAEATTGFGGDGRLVAPVREAAETAGVSVETVERVAEAMTDGLGARVLGMGVNQSVQGTATSGRSSTCVSRPGTSGREADRSR